MEQNLSAPNLHEQSIVNSPLGLIQNEEDPNIGLASILLLEVKTPIVEPKKNINNRLPTEWEDYFWMDGTVNKQI